MSAVITRMVRTGAYGLVPAIDQPDLYGHVTRVHLRHQWLVTAGRTGRVLAGGRALTRGGAWVKAIAAAHKPGIGAA